MRDKAHDEIENRIDHERKRHLLAWYKGIDFSDDPEHEVQTVEWLKKRNAFSKEEADARIRDIRSHEVLPISGPTGDTSDKKMH